VAKRNLLDREQLLALVEDLYKVITHQSQRQERPRSTGSSAHGDAHAGGSATSIPDGEFTIVFDGGAIGNPGKGYGSYQIRGADGFFAERRLEFGDRVTNNQAEFMTIIRALDELRTILGTDAKLARVKILGDSQLVINTITGAWKARHPNVIPLQQQAVALLREFGQTNLTWQPRSKSVAILGH
jgi:ribonuclease HI